MRAYFSEEFGQQPFNSSTNSAIPLDILKSVLVDGFGDQIVTSLTRSGTTATVMLTSPHGVPIKFSQFEISGCTQPEYNGIHDAIITGNNVFTFEVAGSPASPATAAVDIHSKVAGAGWTMPHAKTDTVMAVQQGSGNGYYCRFDNTNTKPFVIMDGFRTMTDKDNGGDQFPRTPYQSTELGFYIRNSASRSNLDRDWIIIADDSTFYIWVNVDEQSMTELNDTANYISITGMGDLESAYAGQPVVTTIFGQVVSESYGYSGHNFSRHSAGGDGYIITSESADGLTTTGRAWFNTPFVGQGEAWSQGCAYPHPVTGAMHLSKVSVFTGDYADSNYRATNASIKKGYLKHIYATQHGRSLDHLSTFDGSGDLTGKRLLLLRTSGYSNETIVEV